MPAPNEVGHHLSNVVFSNSLRTVPRIARRTRLLRGARIGVLRISIPSELNISSKRDVNFVSLSRMRHLRSACEVESQIAGLLDNPLPPWLGGDPAQVDPPLASAAR